MKMNVAHLPELKKFHHITVTKFLRKVFQVEKHGLQSFQFSSRIKVAFLFVCLFTSSRALFYEACQGLIKTVM